MRFLVIVVGAGAALVLIAASGLMNYMFMTSLGRSRYWERSASPFRPFWLCCRPCFPGPGARAARSFF